MYIRPYFYQLSFDFYRQSKYAYSPFQKLQGKWVQAFGATISWIFWVDKCYCESVIGWLLQPLTALGSTRHRTFHGPSLIRIKADPKYLDRLN